VRTRGEVMFAHFPHVLKIYRMILHVHFEANFVLMDLGQIQ
jgi:hypothetical protein